MGRFLQSLAASYDPATTRANPSGAGLVRDPFVNTWSQIAI